jgi:exonuclease III
MSAARSTSSGITEPAASAAAAAAASASSLPPPTITTAGSGADALTILNWNINGLRSISMRANPLPGLFAQYGADIVCFQETKISSWEDVSREHAFVPGYEAFFSFSRARKGWSGVATYVREGCTVSAREDLDDPALDGEGRIILTDHGKFCLANVYFPNGALFIAHTTTGDTAALCGPRR